MKIKKAEKKCWENGKKKLHEHKSFFSYKESLFSLGNYVWDEKWPSFIIPPLIWKLSIVTPFELDKFHLYPNQGSPSTLGGKGEEKAKRNIFSGYKRLNAWCWKANVRNWSSKRCWVHSMENRKMNKTKMLKKEPREIENQRKIEKKERWIQGPRKMILHVI